MNYKSEPPLLSERVKAYCEWKILKTVDDHTQKNIISNAAAATDKKLGGQTLTAEEQLNIDGNADMAVYIKDMRAAAQANLTDPNFATATYWPAPSATLLAAKAQN